jgi:hypothetical protein
VKANVPSVLAKPPVKLDEARVSPEVIPEAVGAVVMVGVALLVVTLTVVVALL